MVTSIEIILPRLMWEQSLAAELLSKGLIDSERLIIPDCNVNLDWRKVRFFEDMALLKRELGTTKTLMGGINCDVFLAGASRESVDAAVKRTLETMAPGGRFILYPIPGVYAGVPWEKVLWLIDSWRRYA